uniref:RAB38, member RAS onco family n=2 Tax=Equus TaxID=9789 RepID=A0A3Q2I0W6_HORSE
LSSLAIRLSFLTLSFLARKTWTIKPTPHSFVARIPREKCSLETVKRCRNNLCNRHEHASPLLGSRKALLSPLPSQAARQRGRKEINPWARVWAFLQAAGRSSALAPARRLLSLAPALALQESPRPRPRLRFPGRHSAAAGSQDAGPAQGAPVQAAGDRRPGRGQDQHHQTLRAPELLLSLPGHHRRGLRAQSAPMGPGDSGAPAAVGHRSSHVFFTTGLNSWSSFLIPIPSSSLLTHQLVIYKGQERFGNMTRVYYREAMGAFIVFDVTRPATFEAVTKWKNDLDSKLSLPNGKPISVVLLANKCDQGKDVLMNNGLKMDQFCKEHGFVGWFETSAKENINIDEASRCLVKHILANECDLMESIEPDIVKPRLTSSKVVSCSSCAKS